MPEFQNYFLTFFYHLDFRLDLTLEFCHLLKKGDKDIGPYMKSKSWNFPEGAYNMTADLTKRKRPYEMNKNTKVTLFYLFFIAQICALFGLVVGILFFILRFFRIIG